jgi:hypothetical protein
MELPPEKPRRCKARDRRTVTGIDAVSPRNVQENLRDFPIFLSAAESQFEKTGMWPIGVKVGLGQSK